MSNAASTPGAKPIVLAYSGGLDTSFLVPWVAENYGRPIITVTVDTGGIDDAARRTLAPRAEAPGAGGDQNRAPRAHGARESPGRRGPPHRRRARRLLRAGAALPDHGQRASRPALPAVRG